MHFKQISFLPSVKSSGFQTYKKIKATGIYGTVRVPAAKIDTSALTLDVAHINERRLRTVPGLLFYYTPFVAQPQPIPDRSWPPVRRTILRKFTREVLTQGLIQGKSVNVMSSALAAKMGIPDRSWPPVRRTILRKFWLSA